MNTFKMMKLRSYFIHIVIGVVSVVVGISILYAIVFEMLNAYQPGARLAYICGILSCAGIICYGGRQSYKALYFEKRLFRNMDKSQVEQFYGELKGDIRMRIPGQCVVTRNYLMIPVRGSENVHILPKEELIGCFHTDTRTGEKTATEMTLVFYDKKFKSYVCEIKSRNHVDKVEALYKSICGEQPWIFCQDYDAFLVQSRKKSHRRKLIKQLETRKEKYLTGYSGEQAAQEELEALAREAEEKLDAERIKKRWFSRKSK